ncbi:MAG: LysE family transporter [Alphaproteobacteria bacterium]|nr:LysE family transporter [Alphaproteobacteria bacterium]
MDIFLKWLLFASVNAAAIVWPGPAFAMTVRSAVAHGRRSAILTAVGLGLGVGVHVLLVLGGIAVLVSRSALTFSILKYTGAAYLVYMGIQGLRIRQKNTATMGPLEKSESGPHDPPETKTLVWNGILTNLLNPKAAIFFTAVYSQFITPDMPPGLLALYGLTSVAGEIIWFSMVALFLTDHRVKAWFLSLSHWIERACGGLLILLGIRLALSRIN